MFLRNTLKTNPNLPPTSDRALMYTVARRNARFDVKGDFISRDDIRSEASDLPEGRVYRDFAGVFLVIDDAREGAYCDVSSLRCRRLGRPRLRML